MSGESVARYHRVSTEQQALRRQAQATEEYVEENYPDASVTVYADADTGTDTDRSGYTDLMADARDGTIDIIIVKDMSRIARSVRDLMRTVDELREAGVSMEFIDDPIDIHPDDDDPTNDLILQVLGAVAEFEAKITRQRVREGIAAKREEEDYHHGNPPIGFTTDDGVLVETAEYDRVCTVLEMVVNDELSKRKAAKRLGCARATIGRAIENKPELYGLASD